MADTLTRSHPLKQGQLIDGSCNLLSTLEQETDTYLLTMSGLDSAFNFYINKATTTDRSGDAPHPGIPYYDSCLGIGIADQQYLHHHDETGNIHLDGPWESDVCGISGGFYREYVNPYGSRASFYVSFSNVCVYYVLEGGQLQPYRCFYYGTHSFVLQVESCATDSTVFVNEEESTRTINAHDNPQYGWFKTFADYDSQDYLIPIADHSNQSSLQQFVFLIEAIPPPYSVRIPPNTTIWLRLRDPAYPLNPDTLIFTVNEVDVTSSVVITPVINGMELLYDPPVDFEYGSRVYVHVSMSSDHSQSTTFSTPTTPGYNYIELVDSVNILQPGYQLRLGPNALGQIENNAVIDIVGEHTIQVSPLSYEYSAGDTIVYYSPDTNVYNIDYWFEIIPDYRPPWISDIYPEPEATDIDVDTYISFHIWDLGLGVNINSLVFRVNNMDVFPEITRYADDHYYVYYKPPKSFYFLAYIHCFVLVYDLSEVQNYTIEFWRFKTKGPQLPLIQGFNPEECDYDVPLDSDVSVDVYGRDSGLDLANLLLTIDEVEYDYEVWPELYRPEDEEESEE